jgi:hypothetical protein
MTRRWATDRIEIEYMDQSNLEDLCRIAMKHGPFDIVIEDGSHLWEHQTTTLRTLFPFVRPEGIYVVEDLQTNFGEYQADYRGVAQQSCVEFLKQWLDLHIADHALPLIGVGDAFLRTYARAARTITFYKRLCLIEKRALGIPLNAVPMKPLIEREPAATDARAALIAHLSHVGDTYGGDGYVDLGHDRFTFQGIAVEDPDQALEYRVRGPDMIWGPWTRAPDFAGTRGRAQILTGAAFRLRETAKGQFKLSAAGRFAGRAAPISANGVEECEIAEEAELRGLQIVLAREPTAVT